MAASNNSGLADLFDDDSMTKNCFDFNGQGAERSWCTSSNNSSCCSLCRLSNESMDAGFDIDGAGNTADDAGMPSFVSSTGLSLPPDSATNPVSVVAALSPVPNDSMPNSMLAASMPSPSQEQLKPCQDCDCSIKNHPMMPSLFGTCLSCQSSSSNLAVSSSFMMHFASKQTSFLSREEMQGLQTILYPASAPRQKDLLTTLSEGPLCAILSFLDVNSLVNLRLINTKLRSLACDNNAGWKNHCAMLWSQKVRVCPNARRLLDSACAPVVDHLDDVSDNPGTNSKNRKAAMEAYMASLFEAKTNCELSDNDLCFDLSRNKSGVMWSFRFKESAGMDWTSWDPWWNNSQARKLVFMRNGSILQSYPQGRSPVVTVHNSTPLYDVFSERTVQRNGVDIIPPRIEMRWRFVAHCMDLPRRPDGAYVRITVGGRDVPTYVVRRSPNMNWGFIMESCWGLYASFELGARNERAALEGPAGRRALRRTRNGSLWVNVEDEANDNAAEEAENTRNVRRRPNPNMLIEDSTMTVTGVSQWREALLYNIGAVTLPEGSALNQFDAAWQNAMLLR